MSDRTKLNVIEAVQLIAAAALFISPFALGFSSHAAPAWSAWFASGAAILFASLITADMTDWSGWGTLAAGLWTTVAPAMIGFLPNIAATWSHILLGGIIALGAIAVLHIGSKTGSGGPDDCLRTVTI
jgi:hypothetical protein